MTPRRLTPSAAAALLLVWAGPASAAGQNATPAAPATAAEPTVHRTTGSRVAIGRSIHVARDEEVSDVVVVVGGSLRIDGRVRDGVFVVGGDVTLGPDAEVRGDVVLVGGRLTRDPKARLRGSVSDVSFGDWTGWSIGGLGLPTVRIGEVGPWLTLFGTVFRLSLLAVLMAAVLLVARAPVARIGRSAGAEPVRAFVVGLLAVIGFVPALVAASIGLIITLIGIPLVALLVPLAFAAAFVALLLGFTALVCRFGEWIEDRLGWRSNNAYVATIIGLAVVVAPTVLARIAGLGSGSLGGVALAFLLVGIVVEATLWVTGVGAALLTGFGRWSTAPPPLPGGTVVPARA